jgi:flagellar basal-body rod protein FlgB
VPFAVNKHNTIVLRGVSFFKVHLLGITGMLFQQSSSMPIAATHPRHIAVTRRRSGGLRIVQDNSTSIRNDGSNVDVDREMVMLLENQLHYQAMADVISRNLGYLRLVIGEGR